MAVDCRKSLTWTSVATVLLVGALLIYIQPIRLEYSMTVLQPYNVEQQTAAQVATTKFEPKRTTFVYGAYILPDARTLRLTLLRFCSNKKPLYARLNLTVNGVAVAERRLSVELLNPGCPWFYAPKCSLDGFVAQTVFPSPLVAPVHSILVSTASSPSRPFEAARVVPHLVQVSHQKHRLAVCVPPMALFADWVMLARWTELWLLSGATKFFFYEQSVTGEVEAVLEIYERDGLLERVPWPYLPDLSSTNASFHWNAEVYSRARILAGNDCAIRTRGIAEFVAFVDVDELIVPAKGTLLELLKAEKAATGCLLVRSSRVHFLPNATNVNIEREAIPNKWAAELDFAEQLSTVYRHRKVFPVSQQSKLICRPDSVRQIHVHSVRLYEKAATKYSTHNVAPETALVYHMRKLEDLVDFSNESLFTADKKLAAFAQPATRAWRARVGRQHPKGLLLKDRGTSVMLDLENCWLTVKDRWKQTCASQFPCMKNITLVRPIEWRAPANCWHFVVDNGIIVSSG